MGLSMGFVFCEYKSDGIWRSYQSVLDVSFLPEQTSIIMTVKDKRIAHAAIEEFETEFQAVSTLLQSHNFPYTEVTVVREKKAMYRGRISLT